jgi:CubicO group peptidase (beta-lactamase class C family)
MKISLLLSLAACAGILVPAARAAVTALPRSTPEAQGVPSAAIQRFVEAAGAKVDAINSFMLVRHGQVIAEGWWSPYAANEPHTLFSLSKSFTSTAVGLAVAEGRLSIDDPVLKFFPDEAPANPGKNLQAMRVRDLLTMSTGHHLEDIDAFSFGGPDNLVRKFLAMPVPHKPGTLFAYNTPATYMQSAIVQKLTGQTVLDYLRPRLFEPLGIENPRWEASAQGISLGGYGLHLKTEDIAKFGLLYLHKGEWAGKQLVPAAWVEQATAKQVSNGSEPTSDWDQGYGFQFWRCRHGFYRGDGAFGQFCIVMPQYDAVLAITSGTRDMQQVMNLAWDLLVPALQPAALPADAAALGRLQQTLGQLVLTPVTASSAPTVQLSGRRYAVEAKPGGLVQSVAFGAPTAEGQPLRLVVNGATEDIVVPAGGWRRLADSALGTPEDPVAVSGGWTAPDTFTLKICHYRTPFMPTARLRLVGEQLLIDVENNVGFGNTKPPQLVGQLVR